MFIAAVAEFAKIMKDSNGAEVSQLQDVLQMAETYASGEREEDFVALVKKAIKIRG
ncbi:DUF3520 domain-containing protein [Paenibacillus sp. MMS18-CY102]|nr:DUF3520 domain-containing protein [Paenibacillus sp. MMS18-CY102]